MLADVYFFFRIRRPQKSSRKRRTRTLMKLRVGIIGLGESWEKGYRPALRTLSDRFEVKALCAEVSHLAQQAAREFGARSVDGFRALCQLDDIEAVLILSPEWYGSLPIYAASEAGKAIYCSSAFDISPVEADKLRRCVDESGVAFMAEFPHRLSPATIRLKELIATRLGRPRLLFCHRRSLSKGKGTRTQAGHNDGFSQELTMLVDWCSYVVGTPATSVFGVRHFESHDEVEDYHVMNLDFSPLGQLGQGATAQISCGRYMPLHWPEAIHFRPPAALQVACERGVAFIDLPATLTWFDAAGRHLESLEAERPVGEMMLLQFHRAVTSLLRKSGDLESAHRSLQIVEAAQRSAIEGRRIFWE
jgi:predicted dehydrogenase